MSTHKIVFIANQYYPNIFGGAEITLQTLAEELAGRGTEIVVISIAPDGTDAQDVVNGIRVHRIAVRNLYTPFGGARSPTRKVLWHLRDIHNGSMAAKVGKILDDERPDVVSTHNFGGFSAAIWGEAKKRRILLSHTLHDYYLLCPKTTMFSGGRDCVSQCTRCRLFSEWKRIASRHVDIVIGVSRFVLDAHLERGYFPNARPTVIFNSRVWKVPATPEVRAANLPLRIGFIGRVEREKGIEVLLQAVAKLPRGSWVLRVAGRPPDPSYLDRLRAAYPLPQVEYLGYSSAEAFYPTVDLLVVPSLWSEPLPTVVFEAMGFGIPVLASRLGGLPEMIDGSDAGWIFAAGDVDELASLLGSRLADRQAVADMRPACLAHRQIFTPTRQADEFIAALSGAG